LAILARKGHSGFSADHWMPNTNQSPGTASDDGHFCPKSLSLPPCCFTHEPVTAARTNIFKRGA
jgi:hypothetical protein